MYHLLTYNIHIPCDKETDLGFKLIAQYNVKIHHHKMCQTLTIMIILTKSWPERKRAFTITLIVMISKHGLYLTLLLWKGLTLALLHRWWWSTNITLTLQCKVYTSPLKGFAGRPWNFPRRKHEGGNGQVRWGTNDVTNITEKKQIRNFLVSWINTI